MVLKRAGMIIGYSEKTDLEGMVVLNRMSTIKLNNNLYATNVPKQNMYEKTHKNFTWKYMD